MVTLPSIVSEKITDKFDQGTLFNCAYAEQYPNSLACGIIITARCDIAQGKAPKYNYIPAVPISDWFTVDGLEVLASRCHRKTYGKIKNQVLNDGYAQSLLDVHSVDTIQRYFYDITNAGTKSQKDKCQKMQQHIENLRICDVHSSDFGSTAKVQEIGEIFRAEKNELLKELISQKLLGHYYIGYVDAGLGYAPYVALLREVNNLPRQLSYYVRNAVTEKELSTMFRGSDFRLSINFNAFDTSMPIGQIPTPQIEHLMQQFTLLFSRIGVDDADLSEIDQIWSEAIMP